jgi:hypothetical protein
MPQHKPWTTDFFGIGAAMRGMANVYFIQSRRSGRTISLINSLKGGDRVVFTDERHARHAQLLAKERGIELDYVIIDPRTPGSIFERASSQGRTIFDHSWVEEFFLHRIDEAIRDIDRLQVESSGYGEAHIETRRKAEEVGKWMRWLPPETSHRGRSRSMAKR